MAYKSRYPFQCPKRQKIKPFPQLIFQLRHLGLYELYSFLFPVFLLCLPASGQNERLKTAAARTEKAIEVFSHFSALGSDSLPLALFKKAKAVAVFSEIKKDNWFLNVLAKDITGHGLLTFRKEDAWSVPTFLSCRGIEMGPDLKVFKNEKLGTVFLFMNDKSVELIKRGDIRGGKIVGAEFALGPLVKGKGSELTIEKAAILYYTFEENKLSGEELKSTHFSDAFAFKHNEDMNRAIFGKKFKAILSANSNSPKIPEVERFRQAIAESSAK